jgi:hypothetical protein
MSVSVRNTPSPAVQAALESGRNSGRPFIRLARFEDYDQIAALEARHGLTVKPRKQWLDLWQDNPTFLALDDWPIGWVVRTRKETSSARWATFRRPYIWEARVTFLQQAEAGLWTRNTGLIQSCSWHTKSSKVWPI